MKKEKISIANPDELNKHLQYTSPTTWIILGIVMALLLSFIVWSCIFKIKIKITGTASINNNEVTIHIEEADKNKIEVGQKVYISNLEGEIKEIVNDEPVITTFELPNGDYSYYIVIKEMKPIDFLTNT